MNILIFNWRDPLNPKSGGAEIVTLEHAKQWVKKGHQVTWFASSFLNVKREEYISGVKIVRRGNAITVLFYAYQFYIRSSEKFDVVVDEIHGVPFFTPLYVKVPIVAFIHEVSGKIWDYMYPFPINLIGRFVEKISFKLYRSIRFWTDAPSTIEELIQYGIPQKNCIAIPCPVTNGTITILPEKEKTPTYIFVSRLVKMKGVEDVIKAFSIISHQQKNAKLWLVGSGEKGYTRSLHLLSKQLQVDNKIRFWGKVTENHKLTLMQRAHVLLHASVKEGWGLVVLEAASQGTPSIVYNVVGLVDSVKNKKTGIVVGENSPKAMAKEVIMLYTDTRRYKVLQRKGIQWVKSLTWDDVAKKSLKLLLANTKG